MYDFSLCAFGEPVWNDYTSRDPNFRRAGLRGFGYMLPAHPPWPRSDHRQINRASMKKNKTSRADRSRRPRSQVHVACRRETANR